MASVQFGSPLGLLALAIPIVYLLFARHLVHIERRLVGSLVLWRRVAEVESQARQGGRITWRTLLLFLALTAIALTAGGPELSLPREVRTWSLVLGRGPAGGLSNARAEGGVHTRLEGAVAAGVAFAKEQPRGDRFRWIGVSGQVFEAGRSAAPPPDFLQAALRGPERKWGAWDRGDCLWLPVSGAGPAAQQAGVSRDRLAAAPGIVARTDAGTWAWAGDAEMGLQLAAVAARPVVWVSGAALAEGEPLRRFVEAWATARDADVVTSAAEAVLHVTSPARGEPVASVRVGRDGWLASATPASLADKRGLGLTPFLRTDGITYAGSAPGRIELGFVHLDEPEGDPAAFAVSWATLFEETVLAPPGVVAVALRRAAEPQEKAPAGMLEVPDSTSWPLGAPLALLGGLLLFLGLRR